MNELIMETLFFTAPNEYFFVYHRQASEPHKEIKITLFIVWLIGYNQKQKVESSKLPKIGFSAYKIHLAADSSYQLPPRQCAIERSKENYDSSSLLFAVTS